MVVKERLLAISELKLSGILNRMDAEELEAYIQKLSWFIDNIPVQEFKIKKALEERDYDALTQGLTTIWDMLMKIHADDLANTCYKQIKVIRNIRDENLETYITGFLTVVSALSIDIQLAEYKKKEEKKVPPPVSAPDEPEEEPRRIVAVDDKSFFLNTLKSFLKNTEYKLTCVTSGPAALRFLGKKCPDLFILDIEMPEMNGIELAMKIKEREPDIPLIFLTGNANKKNVIKAIEAGASDFILKPIDREQVLAKIAKFI